MVRRLERRLVAARVVDKTSTRQSRIAVVKSPSRHEQLWDNVELYLLGCRRGIAIVEDKYLPELNPNVAMDWAGCGAWGVTSFISSRRISLGSVQIGVDFWKHRSTGRILGQVSKLESKLGSNKRS
jgi:hypothetical protein